MKIKGGIMFFKKTNIKVHTEEVQEIEGIETWMVSWNGFDCRSSTFADYVKKYQAFTDEDSAKIFIGQLEDAQKIIGISSSSIYDKDMNKIRLTKQVNGL